MRIVEVNELYLLQDRNSAVVIELQLNAYSWRRLMINIFPGLLNSPLKVINYGK